MGLTLVEEDIEFLKLTARELCILDSVIFTGFVERSKAFQIVKSANVCISPFYPTPILNSTSPTKLIEYMALGKAVVGNDHPEQKMVINQSRAGICVPYRESDFAEAIIYLLAHPDINEKMRAILIDWLIEVHYKFKLLPETLYICPE